MKTELTAADIKPGLLLSIDDVRLEVKVVDNGMVSATLTESTHGGICHMDCTLGHFLRLVNTEILDGAFVDKSECA